MDIIQPKVNIPVGMSRESLIQLVEVLIELLNQMDEADGQTKH